MAKSFKCADIGQNCSWVSTANTTSDLMKKIMAHVDFKHDMALTTGEKIKIQSSIKDR
ncbi:MAG: DUF1059 domain-containing protein [Nitrosopumilus sp.]